jgi:hypothetical protein
MMEEEAREEKRGGETPRSRKRGRDYASAAVQRSAVIGVTEIAPLADAVVDLHIHSVSEL